MEFNFYSDPAHGWCQVPITLINELGIKDKISDYSYMRGDYAYLEEDCDYSVLVRALIDKKIPYTLNEIHQERTPIRFYDQFSAARC